MSIARNIAAVVAGLIIGSIVNMGIVVLGPSIIPPPAGVDVTDPESIAASIHLFEPKHFLTPFLAHALGSFVGALVAWFIAGERKELMAWIIGGMFLAGGIYASTVIPAPTWFMAADIVLAYLPMAWLGIKLAGRIQGDDAAGAG
jgi:hypothetical protein